MKRIVLLAGMVAVAVGSGRMAAGCSVPPPDDPHALPEFGVETAEGGEAEPNVDPQNDDVAIAEPVDREFGGHHLHLPGGASRSAHRMLDLFERDRELAASFRGARVLELGSGTGLAGLAAAALGAESVTFTDQEAVMDLLRDNVTPNLAGLAADREPRVRFDVLQWGDDDPDHPLAGEAFDLILGADLVYAKEAMRPLVHTIRRFGGRRAVTLLAYVHRFPWAREFFEEMDRSHTRRLIDRGNGVWIFEFRAR